MKQDKVYNATKKAIETPLAFTRSVTEKSKKLRQISPRADRVGTLLGSLVGAGLVAAGAVQALNGKGLYALGAVAAGAITLVSNHYHCKTIKR